MLELALAVLAGLAPNPAGQSGQASENAARTEPIVPTIALSQLDLGQAAIMYDQCLARAAGKLARSDKPADEVYGAAKSACAPVRALLLGNGAEPQREQALSKIDREREASFPARVLEFRKMLDEHGLQTRTPN